MEYQRNLADARMVNTHRASSRTRTFTGTFGVNARMSHRALTSGSAVVGGSGAGGKGDGRGGNGDDGGGVFMRVFRILPPVAFTLEKLFDKNLPKIRASPSRRTQDLPRLLCRRRQTEDDRAQC